MFCQHCGKAVAPGQKFCKNCNGGLQSQLTAADYYLEAYYYYSGSEGYPVNYQKAYYFFERSAKMGNLEAVNYIGLMHMNGTGVPQNTSLAIQWFTQALNMNKNFGRAHYNLGRIYYEGIGVQKHYDRAYTHFMYAIRCGKEMSYYGYACHFVGYILMEIQKRPSESVQYFLEAINHQPNLAEAWHNLGVLCESNYYKPGNGFTELFFFVHAAELGYVDAMDAAGKHFLKIAIEGEPYQQKEALKNAKKWLQKAVDGGSESAKTRLFSAKCLILSEKLGGLDSATTARSSTARTQGANQSPAFTQGKPSRVFTYYDGRGHYSASGNCFYDFKGNLCEWGKPFYDSRGNLCEWGGLFYDGRGNLCEWGKPFYDSKGNYIVP